MTNILFVFPNINMITFACKTSMHNVTISKVNCLYQDYNYGCDGKRKYKIN